MKPVRNDSIVILMVVLAIVAFFIGKGVRNDDKMTEVLPEDSAAFTQWKRGGERGNYARTQKFYNTEGKKAERFYFDPNNADSITLSRLGLRQWQVRNILKYRQKGGKFRKPTDFARLYGLSPSEYKSLEPYIRIADEGMGKEDMRKEEGTRKTVDSMNYIVKMKEGETLELNSVDTTALKKVPGIGSAYARAIVNYRNRLGGYARVEQLKEISGLPESALSFFTIGKVEVKCIDVNRMTIDQLKKHPYINFYQARSIVEHRRLHGPLRSVAEMRMMSDFTEKDIERLLPYLKF